MPIALRSQHFAEELAWSGNRELLTATSIGVCGSRKASDYGLDLAHRLGELATAHDLVVVSGYAGGVDQQAHLGALESGGSTIAVLAEGLAAFAIRVRLRELVTASNFLAVSEFPAEAKWISWRAMQRNKTIVAISSAMFVVESGESGGTLEAGREALRQNKPLFVLEYKNNRLSTKGNRLLLEMGAHPLSTRGDMKRALELVRLGRATGVRRLL